MNSPDLNPLLHGWPYVPGQVTVRRILGRDGKPKVQLRLDLGVLQMELDGRPDGQRPMEHESLLDYYRELATHWNEAIDALEDSSEEFQLTPDDCGKLHQEAMQYYHRYLALFALGDWGRVIRDTTRNLELFDFMDAHAPADSGHGASALSHFRPYVLMMRTRALAHRALDSHRPDQARLEIATGVAEIEQVYAEAQYPEAAQSSPELAFLRHWLAELETYRKPSSLSPRQRLEAELQEAVDREDYETAAQLRDSLRQL